MSFYKTWLFVFMALILVVVMLNVANAGFEIFVRPQVTPQYITVNGAYGAKEQRLNPGPAVNAPGVLIFRPANFSPYSTATANRSELRRTPTGSATDAAVFAAFPGLKAKYAEEITAIRQQALDKIARSPGIFSVYDENWRAAKAFEEGRGSEKMKNDITVIQYLEGLGSQVTPPLTAAQFAAYIKSENGRVTPLSYAAEQQYMWFTRTVIPAEQYVDELLDLPNQYRRFCGL